MVNGSVGALMGFRFGRPSFADVEFTAAWKTGRKYAPSPPRPAITKPSATIQIRGIEASGPPREQTLEAAQRPVRGRIGTLSPQGRGIWGEGPERSQAARIWCWLLAEIAWTPADVVTRKLTRYSAELDRLEP